MSLSLVAAVLQGSIGVVGALGISTVQSYGADDPPANFEIAASTVLEPVAVASLFGGKTWLWPNGGGYFREDGKFLGFGEESFGDGRWEVTPDGKLCFFSVWQLPSSEKRIDRCFLHRAFEGHVYQLVEGENRWYLFKHSQTAVGDEFTRLVTGNHVDEKIAEIKFDIEQHRARHSR